MKLPTPICVATTAINTLFVAVATLFATPNLAHAIILDCPPVINVKAVGAPYPWSDAQSADDAILHFAEASYSCSNGTCTLSCAYAASSSVYTMLSYKVAPGVCHYTSEGKSFACSSLPPPRHR
jgi:hypothetical protein